VAKAGERSMQDIDAAEIIYKSYHLEMKFYIEG
jgi:hypothetical protein